MSTTSKIAITGAIVFTVYLFLHPAEDPASIQLSPYALIHMLGALGMTLTATGILGSAESMRQQLSRLGWLAYLMAGAGSVLWVGLMFFDGFVNHVLVRYAPEYVHTTLERTVQFYGWALVAVAACLFLFAAGFAGVAIAATRRGLLTAPWAILLAFGAAVFCAALFSHDIEPIVIERIGFVPFVLAFIRFMAASARQASLTVPHAAR